MKQRAHAWVALRALKLLDDSGKVPKLVELLSYYLSDVWDGAWLPDTMIVDMAYGHIFKMDSDPKVLGSAITPPERFTTSYKTLKQKLAGKRLCLEYVKDSEELNIPYRSHPDESIGGHLPNRVIAVSHSIRDMLKMSDFPLAFYAKNKKSKAYIGDLSEQKIKSLSLSPNFSARQIALTFFIVSHYIADAHMPLHCDLRDYGSKSAGISRRLPKTLHPSIEEKWDSYFPEKETVTLHDYLKKSVDEVVKALPRGSPIKIDTEKKYALGTSLPKIKGDEWAEMAYVTRVAYAVSRKWIAQPYNDANALIRKDKEEFTRVTNCIFYDAVESVASIWYKIWLRYQQ